MTGRGVATLRALYFAAAAALAAAIVPVSAGALTGIAADAPPKAFWRAVMEEFYGPYDRSLTCWIGKVGDERVCMRPHRLDTVAAERGPLRFVVTAGHALTENNGYSDCHACSGAVGLIVLGEAGGRLELVARNSLAEPAGAWGQAPGEDEFRLRAIGDDVHGWTMETGWTGQGYTLGSTVVFGVSGDDVIELGTIPVHSDNAGTCGDGLAECFVHSYELVFDEGSGRRYRDIVLRRLPESTAGPESFRVPFDLDALRYAAPDDASALFDQ